MREQRLPIHAKYGKAPTDNNHHVTTRTSTLTTSGNQNDHLEQVVLGDHGSYCFEQFDDCYKGYGKSVLMLHPRINA